MKSALRGTLAAALVPLAFGWAGCGGGGAASFPAGEHPAAGGGGVLTYVLPPVGRRLDPLSASGWAQQTVSAQVFEPLTGPLRGPYGAGRAPLGMALGAGHSGDRRVWSVHLRPGVRFQDGTPLNGSAVLVNAERWRSSAAGRLLLPGLLAASAPRPDLVRFIFSDPVDDLPALLADPRLGLVSPPALRPASGRGAAVTRSAGAGSGPFELAHRSGAGLALARNRTWWGKGEQLGPALDRIEFQLVPGPARRLELLRRRSVRVAGGLSSGGVAAVERDPLLSAAAEPGGEAVGFERSVRGLASARPRPLNAVWLALVGRP